MIGGVLAKRVINAQQSLIKIPARNIYPQSSSNHISGMPRNRIPFPEKVATGIFIALSILATPAWIVTHMEDYRGSK